MASGFDGATQTLIWIAALAVDYVGAAFRGIARLAPEPGHFAERHGLIVIIALGESIVAIGVGAEGIDLGAGELVAAALGVIARRARSGGSTSTRRWSGSSTRLERARPGASAT